VGDRPCDVAADFLANGLAHTRTPWRLRRAPGPDSVECSGWIRSALRTTAFP
jgi:hypothetical protein